MKKQYINTLLEKHKIPNSVREQVRELITEYEQKKSERPIDKLGRVAWRISLTALLREISELISQ